MLPKICKNALLCLTTLPVILLTMRSSSSPPSQSSSSKFRQFRARVVNTFPVFDPVFNPTHHHDANRTTDYVFQIPSSPVALLFLAHGCGRSARSFWDAHSGCPNCFGLPEERAFVISALRRRFAVIAISSTTVCWNLDPDLENVVGILAEWMEATGLGLLKLPVVGLGSSTGGWFLSRLALQFRFAAIALMVAEARFHKELDSTYPPVMFVHMVKDVHRVAQVKLDMAAAKASGVPVTEYLVHESPVVPDWFARRIPYIENATSALMVAAMNGSLTQEKMLKNDARRFDWSEKLEEQGLLPPQLREHVLQALNVAFAFHEFASLPTPEILQWFEDHSRANRVVAPASAS